MMLKRATIDGGRTATAVYLQERQDVRCEMQEVISDEEQATPLQMNLNHESYDVAIS